MLHRRSHLVWHCHSHSVLHHHSHAVQPCCILALHSQPSFSCATMQQCRRSRGAASLHARAASSPHSRVAASVLYQQQLSFFAASLQVYLTLSPISLSVLPLQAQKQWCCFHTSYSSHEPSAVGYCADISYSRPHPLRSHCMTALTTWQYLTQHTPAGLLLQTTHQVVTTFSTWCELCL